MNQQSYLVLSIQDIRRLTAVRADRKAKKGGPHHCIVLKGISVIPEGETYAGQVQGFNEAVISTLLDANHLLQKNEQKLTPVQN
jgi:hypothetical protein